MHQRQYRQVVICRSSIVFEIDHNPEGCHEVWTRHICRLSLYHSRFVIETDPTGRERTINQPGPSVVPLNGSKGQHRQRNAFSKSPLSLCHSSFSSRRPCFFINLKLGKKGTISQLPRAENNRAPWTSRPVPRRCIRRRPCRRAIESIRLSRRRARCTMHAR